MNRLASKIDSQTVKYNPPPKKNPPENIVYKEMTKPVFNLIFGVLYINNMIFILFEFKLMYVTMFKKDPLNRAYLFQINKEKPLKKLT